MSATATVAGASAGRPLVVDDPGLLPTEQAAAQLSRAVLLRRGFTLLAGCLSDGGGSNDDTRSSGPSGDEMAALLVKEGLWSRRAQLVLIYSLVWPWAGGLLPRASDGDEVEQFLPAAAERLLKHWKTLDGAAGSGNEFSKTLRDLLQVRVFKEVGTRASAGDGGGSGCFGMFDLCQWILSQSLSSQEALSRPFLVVRAGRTIASSSATADAASGSPGESSVGGGARRLQHRHRRRHVPQPPDDELTGRVIRAYRSFANAGIFGSVGDGDPLRLATGLWSTVLRLPEGLRPASEHRANTALRLAIDLGLPTTGETVAVDGSSNTASILASLLDVRPAKRATAAAGRGAGATQGALFYRRFSEPVHEAILKRGAGCPWAAVCKSLVDACLSTTSTAVGAGARDGGRHPLLAAQAFSILEGVLTLQFEQQRVRAAALLSSRVVTTRMMDPSKTLEAIVPEFRRLVDDPDWGPPPPPTANAPALAPKKKARAEGSSSATAAVGPGGRMLRESLRLCHRLLRLAAAVQSAGSYTAKKATEPASSSTRSCFNQLLEMSAALAAGTLGSASPVVDASAKADALTLVPFLRPCLTRKARDYGHSSATPSASGGQRNRNASGVGAEVVLPALEEMVARHFPIEDSREPEEGSEQATTFARLLRGLLAAFVRCGDLGLLELLFGSLAEGRKHLHYSWVSRALDAFVAGLDVERDGVAEAVFGFCLDKIASNRVAASTKATLFDKVCLPMVRRCPVEVSRKLYLSVSPAAGSGFKPIASEDGGDGAEGGVPVLKRLLAVVGRRSDDKLFKDKALLASCCLLLIEALYDMLDLADLQSLADEAFAKKDALKEVTTGVVKAWKAVCRFKRKYDLPWLELRCRRAAFCCVCTVVRSTQNEQKWFNNLVWSDSLYEKAAAAGGAAAVADKTSVLALVLDMEKEHKFEVTPPFFRTSLLVPARPPPFGGGEEGPHGGASGRGRRRGMTASAMLSQSSLAFGGDSLAGGAEQVSDSGNGVGGGGGGGGNAAAEDARETYSSQAALAEPGGVLDADDGGAGTASQPTQYQSQSQGDMAPVFGAGAMEVSGGRGRGVGGTEDRQEVLFLEESHLNKEQCMRSLLLVVQTEERLFGDSWQDSLKQSGGAYEPAWSSKMRAKLADIDLPRNIRLLAFQFAMNAPVSGFLVLWAVPWIRAMADFALAPLPEGLRVDGEKGLHYLLRDFMQLLLDESSAGGGWGGVVRGARAEERREAEAAGDDPGDVSRQPLLGVGNRLVSHLMSVSSYPDGKTAMLRANVMLVAGLVGLFGDVFVEVEGEAVADGHPGGGGGQDGVIRMEGHQMGRRNDLQRLNLQYVVDMLKEREGHTGGAHASTKSTGVQAKHTILTGLNLLGVLLGRRVPVFVESAGPAANELARTLPDVCLSYAQKNAFETGAELLAMALAHVKWLRDGGGLPPEDDLCAALRGGVGTPSGGEGGADGEWLVRRVTDRLMRMGKDGKLRSRFVHAVAAIARMYPAVLTRKLLLESLRAMQFAEAACRGRFLAMLADNIPSGQVPHLEVQDLFTILQPHLPSLLLEPEVEFVRGSKDTGQESEWVPMAQLSALRLLRALTKTMTSKQLGAVLGEDDAHSLMGLATPSTYRGCREIAYAALLDLHVAAREFTASSKHGSPEQDESARGGAALTSAQREAVRCALLRGLSDPDDEGMAFDDKAASDEAETAQTTDDSNDPSQRQQQHPRRGIRRSLLNVFDAPPSEGGGGLEEDPGRRMLALMRDMFDSRTARAWLRFAPYLLLRPAEKAPGYKDVLFKKSLLSCEFVDMPVVGGGGGLEARPMEPAFSFASLSSQQSQDAVGGASYGGGGGGSYGTLTTDVDVRGAGRLRATQDYLWAATQGAGGGGGSGKEPGARAGAAGVRTSHIAFPSQTQGKMLGVSYAGSQAVMPPPPPRAPGTGGKDPRSSQGGVGRRFWRTSGGSMSSMTKGETFGIQRRMAAKRARDKATRTKRAVIYRKYRDGELPDIMIKLGDVLRPLQHLSMLDGGIAREVFVQIFKEVYSGLEGTARAPITAAPLPSDDGGDNGFTSEELENEIRREAAGGEGRRAVAVLLQRMLSSARHDTDVVACLHAACRATSTAAANPLGSTGGDGGRSGPSPSSSASSSALQHRRHLGQQQRAGSHLIGAASRSSSSSSSTVVARGRARSSKQQQQQQEAERDAARGAGTGTAAEEGDAISLSPDLVAGTALSSLNIHSGILLLEDSIMRTGRERAAADASVDASGAPSIGGGQQHRRRRGAKAAQETHGKANVVVDVEKGQQDSWLQLSKLYAALGERDALVGVAARASKSEETRHALEAELSGDYESALKIYRKLMDRYDTRYEKDDADSQHSARGTEKAEESTEALEDDNGVVASEAELRAWDMHQLECMRQLGQWKELQGEVVSMLSEYDDEGEAADSAQFGSGDESGSAECQRRVWGAEPSRRDDLLPFFVWSIVHDHRRSEVALSAFLDAIVDPAAPPLQLADSAWEGQGAGTAATFAAEGATAYSLPQGSSSSCTRLAWLEKNMPGELAKAFLLGGRLGRAHQCVARCYDRFQEKWAGLHPCADSARRDQLRGLQLVVEVEDFLAFHDQKATAAAAAGGLPRRVSGLLEQWSRQAPSDTLDPVTSWSAIIAHRRDCFTAIEDDLEQVELLSEPQGLDCRRGMLKHTADLSLVAAGAAIRQGVKKVAHQLITSYTKLKKKAGGLSPMDKRPPTLGTQGTAARGEEEWDLQLTLITVDFNAAKLERLRLAGTRADNDISAKRAKIIAETLDVLDGYISQQQRAMDTDARRGGRGWTEGEDGVSDCAEARETRLRLLTLQGQWLEMKGNVLLAESSSSSGADEKGRKHGATTSFQGALASLEQATRLGDRLLASPSPSDQPSDASESGPIGSNASSGRGRESAKPQADIAAATGEAMLRLAKLCEGLAAGKVGGGGAGGDVGRVGGRGREELAALAVKEYLRAMAVGSTSAMDRFPRVLVLAGEFPKARQAFADGASAVPAWAFLRWVSQMLGVSGRKEGPVVIQVLERVALVYPRALFYPLLMTKASIKEGASVDASDIGGNNNAQRLSKLTAITFDPSGEAFAEALRGLHHPELRFTDQMKHVLELLVKGEKGPAQKAYRKMRDDCLVIAGRKTGDEKVGTYNREFAKTRISKVDKSLGKGGEHMDPRKVVSWIAEAGKWTTKAKNDAASGRMKLSQFSGWMSDFDSNKHKLEVPGQYGGITAAPPQVSHHSRIVSFGSELLVMGSLRVPKRLTIHGDDERDHMFLVKGGEDLRVDQRVEQLFEVMNAVMAKSASCSRARLSNKTYKVIPVTPEIGLIEWVQNTRPLKSVIEQGLGVPKLWNLPATATFLSFVGTSRYAYHDMFKKRGRPETEEIFAKCCAAVPTDTLRQHLLAMAPSPEAFLTCRRGFARSLATLNACSYILGIGDRHLDNFLLDASTGTVVGIDFGAAFGVGTTELPVPEMIPFRLTNQFQNLLQPLDSVGLLKGHMVSTLQALRGGSEVLLATMDVFLNEPVMEWISDGTQKRQKTTAKKGGESGEEGGEPEIGEGEEVGGSSQPRPPSEAGRKIRNAERKLLGENPASVLIDDLEQNKRARAQGSLEKLKAIAWGRSGDRVRSKPENSEGLLSVEDQVECLIDLATDPDVLGRQYVGLATWV